MGINMFEAMGKLPAIMDILGNIADHKVTITADKSKVLLTLTLKDKSSTDIFIKIDIASKAQLEMLDNIQKLVTDEMNKKGAKK